MRKLTATEKGALLRVAGDLGVEPRTLAALIQFESRWSPTIKNELSSARGLIQFMDATAYEMGYLGPDTKRPAKGASLALVVAHPDTESQLLGPVLDYLKPMAPYPTDQSLFMAVFYPAARKWPRSREFPELVQLANPGIKTVDDYVKHVWSQVGDVDSVLVDNS